MGSTQRPSLVGYRRTSSDMDLSSSESESGANDYQPCREVSTTNVDVRNDFGTLKPVSMISKCDDEAKSLSKESNNEEDKFRHLRDDEGEDERHYNKEKKVSRRDEDRRYQRSSKLGDRRKDHRDRSSSPDHRKRDDSRRSYQERDSSPSPDRRRRSDGEGKRSHHNTERSTSTERRKHHSRSDARSRHRSRSRSRSPGRHDYSPDRRDHRRRNRRDSRSREVFRSKRLERKFARIDKLGLTLVAEAKEGLGPSSDLASQAKDVEARTGIAFPNYYNPSAMNPSKYAQQIQKRRLLWGPKKEATAGSTEHVPETPSGSGSVKAWEAATFKGDNDGKLTEKFKRLMGMKGEANPSTSVPANSAGNAIIKKQEEMFSNMEAQYQVARMATHTHRGVGLGFGTFQVPPR